MSDSQKENGSICSSICTEIGSNFTPKITNFYMTSVSSYNVCRNELPSLLFTI